MTSPVGDSPAHAESTHDAVVRIVAESYGAPDFDPHEWSRQSEQQPVEDLLAGLHDPAIRLLSPDEAASFMADLSADQGGYGLTELLSLDKSEATGLLTVVTPSFDSPAAKARLQAHDVVVAINGKPTYGLTLQASQSLLRSSPPTGASLLVLRNGSRRAVHLQPSPSWRHRPGVVSRRVLKGDIGYIAIARFDEGVGALVRRAAEAFSVQRVRGVVLDLRGNPGGSLDETAIAASAFLPQGATVFHLLKRGKIEESARTTLEQAFAGPVIALVDAGTASAAEITAAALRDNGRARLVGERTFGKALPHALNTLPSGEMLSVPAGQVVTPKKQVLLSIGLAPDVAVAGDPRIVLLEHGRRCATDVDLQFKVAVALITGT